MILGGDGYGFRWVQTRVGGPTVGTTIESLVVWQPEVNDFLARFVARHGAGPHHLTFKVDDLPAMVERCAARGIEPVGVSLENPEWREAFLQPRDAHGTVVQLAQSQDHWTMADLLADVAAGDPRATPRWWPDPPLPGPDPATITRVVLGSPEPAATAAFFADLLDGVVEHDAGDAYELVWPGGGRIRVQTAAAAGVLRLDGTGRSARTVSLSGVPVVIATEP